MDFNEVVAAVAKDEEIATVPLFKKGGDPYLAADGKTQSALLVVGTESKRYKAAKKVIQKAMLKKRRAKVEVEDLDENRQIMAQAGVVGWIGIEQNGKPWTFSPENLNALLSVEHLLEQAENGIANHHDFLKDSSKP